MMKRVSSCRATSRAKSVSVRPAGRLYGLFSFVALIALACAAECATADVQSPVKAAVADRANQTPATAPKRFVTRLSGTFTGVPIVYNAIASETIIQNDKG